MLSFYNYLSRNPIAYAGEIGPQPAPASAVVPLHKQHVELRSRQQNTCKSYEQWYSEQQQIVLSFPMLLSQFCNPF